MDLTPHGPGARRLRAQARTAQIALGPRLPPVLVLSDPLRSADPLDLAGLMPAGWALVYRHFGDVRRHEIAAQLAILASIRGFRLLVGADGELALRVGAHGVHWPQAMGREALRWRGAFMLNTMSAHRPADVMGSQPVGVDARVLSTAFASASPSAGYPLGAVRLRSIAGRASLPVYALGGVNATTAGRISGQCGLAGVGQIGRQAGHAAQP